MSDRVAGPKNWGHPSKICYYHGMNWNHDIPFTSGPTAAILIFCGRGSENLYTQDIGKNALVTPYRLVKTA